MPNSQSMLLQVFCILFLVVSAFGQEQSDSHIVTVTKKIDVAKLNENVEDLNDSVQTLTETIKKLDNTVNALNKTVGDLKVTVARIDERTNRISTLQYVILAAIFGPLLLFIYDWFKKNYDWFKKNKEGTETSTNTAQVSQSEGSPTQVVQKDISGETPTQTIGTREPSEIFTKVPRADFPSGDKLTEFLKSDYNAKTRKA